MLPTAVRHRVAAAALAAALPAAPAQGADFYGISQMPFVVPSALEPNVVLTVDDSVEMQRAFHQDSAALPTRSGGVAAASGCSAGLVAGDPPGRQCPYATRRFKSADFNAMYYDPNVAYRVPPNGQPTRFDKALHNGFLASAGEVNLERDYRAWHTYDASRAASAQTTGHADHAAVDFREVDQGVRAYYYVYDPGNPTPASTLSACTGSGVTRLNDACYRLVLVGDRSGPGGADERQNFANWYSFHRTRSLAAATAASIAASAPALQGARIAWQGLNSCNSIAPASLCSGYDAAGSGVTVSNRLEAFSPARRDDLFAWLRRLPAAGAEADLREAMRRAGDFFATPSSALANNPHRVFPQGAPAGLSANPEHACRPNFHVLVTGNAWTGTGAATCGPGPAICGNADGATVVLPDGTAYPPTAAGANEGRPFRDPHGDTLADVAFRYWATDLRGDLSNEQLPPVFRDRGGPSAAAQYFAPRNDPARWQHMSNTIVAVGVARALSDPDLPWTGSAFSGPGYEALVGGRRDWPSTATDTGRMYDLWHAALNSRGQFLGAGAADQVPGVIVESLSRAPDKSGIGAAIATSSSRLTATSTIFQASYATGTTAGAQAPYATTWTGRLRAIRLQADGSFAATGGWDASLPPERNILTARPTAGNPAAGAGLAFSWAALDGAGLATRFGRDAVAAQQVVDYLRGESAHEQRNGGRLRDRPVPALSDIVNSELVFSHAEDFGYEVLPEGQRAGQTPYATFVMGKAARTPMLYVGANGGMLHAFDANTGREVFAYVPRTLINERISQADQRSVLALLADPGYAHRFFVDGSPWVGDAFWGGRWRTVLLGSTGAGGRGVFALDVTAASAAPAVTEASVLWDLDGSTDPDLGFTIGQPVIGRLPDGHWYAIFGNGYRSANECAVLYLVRLDSGTVRRLSTSEGNLGAANGSTACSTGTRAVFNGLGRPSLYSRADHRITDTIYAADLRGNVWRFDVSSGQPDDWDVALSSGGARIPLLAAVNAAGQPQPITGPIEIGRAPGGLPGVMLYFGTGRILATGDRTDRRVQSFYGVHDDQDKSRNASLTRAQLVAREIDPATRAIGPAAGAPASVPYAAAGSSRRFGFYLDLPAPGERIVTLPLLLPGRLLFATAIPSADPCAEGGTSWIQAIDPFDAAAFPAGLFIAGRGDAFNPDVGIVRSLIAVEGGNRVHLLAGGSGIGGQGASLARIDTLPYSATGGRPRGRTSWRELNR